VLEIDLRFTMRSGRQIGATVGNGFGSFPPFWRRLRAKLKKKGTSACWQRSRSAVIHSLASRGGRPTEAMTECLGVAVRAARRHL
jgi:hypothetical protein